MKYTKAEMFADWIETANTIAADLRRLSAQVDEQARLNGMGAECELKLMAERDELLNALQMWLSIHDQPAGFFGKYGRALDEAIAAQQAKINAAVSASRAAISKATGGRL